MFKGRRVGTFTAGLVMVAFGLLFLSRLIFPTVSYTLIFSMWPVILILLGIEIIGSYFINNSEKMRYDTGAIALVLVLACFSMAMAGAEFLIHNYPVRINI